MDTDTAEFVLPGLGFSRLGITYAPGKANLTGGLFLSVSVRVHLWFKEFAVYFFAARGAHRLILP
jgi:hypothetical protein